MMATVWVLVIILVGPGRAAVTTQEFLTPSRCEAAAKELGRLGLSGGPSGFYTVCVPK
jgi:hypothetical protein